MLYLSFKFVLLHLVELSNGLSKAQLSLTSWTISILDNGPNKCPRSIETMSKWACPLTPKNIYNYFSFISLDFISKTLKICLFSKIIKVFFSSQNYKTLFSCQNRKISFFRKNRKLSLFAKIEKLCFPVKTEKLCFPAKTKKL